MRHVRTIAVTAALLGLGLSGGQAWAWHHHRHHWRYLTIGRPAPEVLPGYHCPLGQWWRPSLRTCQGSPYGGRWGGAPTAARPDVEAPPERAATMPPDVPPLQSGTAARRTVSTDTRVVGRRRRVTRDGVIVTYEVRTKVTERRVTR